MCFNYYKQNLHLPHKIYAIKKKHTVLIITIYLMMMIAPEKENCIKPSLLERSEDLMSLQHMLLIENEQQNVLVFVVCKMFWFLLCKTQAFCRLIFKNFYHFFHSITDKYGFFLFTNNEIVSCYRFNLVYKYQFQLKEGMESLFFFF